MSDLQESFARIYSACQRDLYVYVYRSLRDEGAAQDLIQDAFVNFVRIYQTRPLPEDEQCRMYLFRIARNMLINHSRRFYNRQVDLVEGYESGPASAKARTADVADGVLNRIQNQLDDRLLQELLEGLAEDQRTVLILRFQLDMRLEDIAGVMDVSVSTASRLVQKAQQSLIQAGRKRGLRPESGS
ncbi:MAG: sigma-70 family RNA polymerase sigma factor [Leptospirales bacterium]|nr:sigma-70 family RNA polymerase sigma factor [Leptospirales bacterium]